LFIYLLISLTCLQYKFFSDIHSMQQNTDGIARPTGSYGYPFITMPMADRLMRSGSHLEREN